jgi:gamma-glutamyltranspeptidase/glutathione hydrolase
MFTTRPEIIGSFGVVASTHWLGSAVGMAVLERGGNAFDAAAAVGFLLHVAEPHLNGPGGDMPLILHDAKSGQTRVICGQGVAPAKATVAAYRALGLDLIPGTGLLAAVVPGAVDAWLLLLRDRGSLALRDILAPAIAYAREGCPLVGKACDTIASVAELLRDHWHSTAAIYMPDGTVPKPGSFYRNPTLAATWARLIDVAEAAGSDRAAQIEAARTAWAEGFIAEAIDAFCRTAEVMDVTGRRNRALLTGDDMAKWRASEEPPLTYDYHGYTVAKPGPWSQAPVFLQQLALLRGFDLRAMDPLGPDFAHTVIECAKLAFADREAYYGDPDFVDVPMAALLADDYNAARRKLVGDRASFDLRPGALDGREPTLPRAAFADPEAVMAAAGPGAGEPTNARLEPVEGDTCHIDVIDKWGNMVSATPSGGWLQSSPTIPGLGFCLGSRAQVFWLEEGLPASLAPGRRPRTTLSPCFALKDGKPYMAFGTPGGDTQDQITMAFFLRHVHHGMNLQQAIDAPAFYTDHFPSSFWPRATGYGHVVAEGRTPPATQKELRRRGHDLEVTEDWSQGRLSATTRVDGVMRAGANPRGMQGYAIGR